MSFSKKIRVGVLRGGPSHEYDVSMKSGNAVMQNLRKEKYEPIDIFIDKERDWYVRGVKKTPNEALRNVDVVFNALHGHYGEDGKVQRLMDDLGVLYTGSKSLESALSMNKHLTKEALKKHGIKLAHHKILRSDEMDNVELYELFRVIPHPSVVKPARSGSSVGVSIVRTFFDLGPALEKAFYFGDNVLVEEYISGREATCGVIDGFRNEKSYALPVVEIIHGGDLFDYDAKYSGDTKEICPAEFDEATKTMVQDYAKKVHETLGLRHYSRSDFIVHPKRGVHFLEVNTLPGLTNESLLPKSVAAVGATFPEFLDHIVGLALVRS